MNNVLSAKNIVKRYSDNDGNILDGFNIELGEFEVISLVGASGSGKSTLLHILGLLDIPTNGEIFLRGKNVKLLDRQKTILKHFGFVYQSHNLLQEFSAEENVVLPQLINGVSRKDAAERARYLLNLFALYDRKSFLPGQLSGGQKQRVAIARAIANKPDILLADEPTGNLDVETTSLVIHELLKILKEFGISAIIATHNVDIANMLDRKVCI